MGIILKCTLKTLWKVGDWIHLAYEGYKWWAVINRIMNFQVS